MSGVDKLGLDTQDRRYLETIIRVFGGGPAGIEAVAHTMNIAVDTLIDEVEPFLLRTELVIRTPRGRMVTPKGFQHLQIAPPPHLPTPTTARNRCSSELVSGQWSVVRAVVSFDSVVSAWL